MPGHYERNRDSEGRFTSGPQGSQQWRDDDEDYPRENYGRGQEPPRDDRGRFMSEGERGEFYRGQNYGRGRDEYSDASRQGGGDRYGYEEDNYYRGGAPDYGRGQDYGRGDYDRNDYGRDSQRGGGRDRDEYGRFTSDDDPRRGYGGQRGGYDYDDDHGSRGRSSGQGREATRDRWQESRGSRYRDHDDDRGRGGMQNRGEDHRGWFGDPRGHSQAARLGWRHRR